VDALRRLVQPATGQKSERQVRRVQPSARLPRGIRLRRAERAMSEALAQLREGVPLNWGQVEDDPELLTLARLQGAAQESRLQPIPAPSPADRSALIERLAKRLPAPRPATEKPAPRSLAGFSERVQVLTQAEDDVSLRTNIPRLLVRVTLAVLIVAVVVYGFSALVSAITRPAFSWIELRRGDEVLNRVFRPRGWQDYPCKVERQKNVLRVEWFEPQRVPRVVRSKLLFDVPRLPQSVSQPTTTNLEYIGTSIAPCDPRNPVNDDPGAMLKLDYHIQQTINDPTASSTTASRPAGQKEISGPLIVYVAQEQPWPLDVREGTWHEVNVPQANGGPDMHGVVWQGPYFPDRSGLSSYGEVVVLMLEHDKLIMVLYGPTQNGITEALLRAIAQNVDW
jgi:hypothetical protein